MAIPKYDISAIFRTDYDRKNSHFKTLKIRDFLLYFEKPRKTLYLLVNDTYQKGYI